MQAQLKTNDDIKQLGTILSIWAHPDDESFLAAGVLAGAVKNGQRVICVTATKGEAGVQDETRWPAKSLGQIRSKEMAAALAILGIDDHYWLGYRDGTCDQVAMAEAVAKLRAIIDRQKPDTILTFGPEGWTGHPDHARVSKWCSRAVADSKTDIAVFQVVDTPERFDKYYKKADELLDIFFNIDRPRLLPASQCDIYFELPKHLLQQKIRALAAQPSQTDTMFKLLPAELMANTLGTECFWRVRT